MSHNRPLPHSEEQQIDTYVGGRIKSRREELGFSRVELAATLGIDQHVLEAIEAGVQRPEPSLLAKASDALIVPLYWFFPLQKAPGVESLPAKKTTCPDCGLVLRVKDGEEGLNLSYAMAEWRRLCTRRDLGDPAWCLLQRDRTSPRKKNH